MARKALGIAARVGIGWVMPMDPQVFKLASSPFVPIAIGFFGLGTGYLIWGGQALFELPATSPEVNKTLGMWGFWMPGFMQLGAKAWI